MKFTAPCLSREKNASPQNSSSGKVNMKSFFKIKLGWVVERNFRNYSNIIKK